MGPNFDKQQRTILLTFPALNLSKNFFVRQKYGALQLTCATPFCLIRPDWDCKKLCFLYKVFPTTFCYADQKKKFENIIYSGLMTAAEAFAFGTFWNKLFNNIILAPSITLIVFNQLIRILLDFGPCTAVSDAVSSGPIVGSGFKICL